MGEDMHGKRGRRRVKTRGSELLVHFRDCYWLGITVVYSVIHEATFFSTLV